MTDVTINCGTRLPNLDQSWGATIDRTINRSIVRPIVATYDRSYDQTWQYSGTKRPIVRSIVASCDRSYNQSCDYRAASIHNWWCYHAPLVVRARRTYLRLFLDTTRLNCREQIGLRHFSVHCADGITYLHCHDKNLASILRQPPWAKTIKKNTNSTQNKSQTHRAKQYEVMSFLSTDCELSTETCSKNVYSIGPLCLLSVIYMHHGAIWC